MSELKFRFVDKGDGTVYKPITLKELCLRIELPRRIILESENGDFVDTDDFLDQLENGELIAEQYTSLKDKNGKEIYVGDIVECGPYSGKPIISEEGRYWLGEELEDLFYADLHYYIEVIGNIHENPELLGDTNVTNKEEE